MSKVQAIGMPATPTLALATLQKKEQKPPMGIVARLAQKSIRLKETSRLKMLGAKTIAGVPGGTDSLWDLNTTEMLKTLQPFTTRLSRMAKYDWNPSGRRHRDYNNVKLPSKLTDIRTRKLEALPDNSLVKKKPSLTFIMQPVRMHGSTMNLQAINKPEAIDVDNNALTIAEATAPSTKRRQHSPEWYDVQSASDLEGESKRTQQPKSLSEPIKLGDEVTNVKAGEKEVKSADEPVREVQSLKSPTVTKIKEIYEQLQEECKTKEEQQQVPPLETQPKGNDNGEQVVDGPKKQENGDASLKNSKNVENKIVKVANPLEFSSGEVESHSTQQNSAVSSSQAIPISPGTSLNVNAKANNALQVRRTPKPELSKLQVPVNVSAIKKLTAKAIDPKFLSNASKQKQSQGVDLGVAFKKLSTPKARVLTTFDPKSAANRNQHSDIMNGGANQAPRIVKKLQHKEMDETMIDDSYDTFFSKYYTSNTRNRRYAYFVRRYLPKSNVGPKKTLPPVEVVGTAIQKEVVEPEPAPGDSSMQVSVEQKKDSEKDPEQKEKDGKWSSWELMPEGSVVMSTPVAVATVLTKFDNNQAIEALANANKKQQIPSNSSLATPTRAAPSNSNSTTSAVTRPIAQPGKKASKTSAASAKGATMYSPVPIRPTLNKQIKSILKNVGNNATKLPVAQSPNIDLTFHEPIKCTRFDLNGACSSSVKSVDSQRAQYPGSSTKSPISGSGQSTSPATAESSVSTLTQTTTTKFKKPQIKKAKLAKGKSAAGTAAAAATTDTTSTKKIKPPSKRQSKLNQK